MYSFFAMMARMKNIERWALMRNSIQENISVLKSYLEDNIREKENTPSIPETGMAVLRQQYVLVEAIQEWISSLNII